MIFTGPPMNISGTTCSTRGTSLTAPKKRLCGKIFLDSRLGDQSGETKLFSWLPRIGESEVSAKRYAELFLIRQYAAATSQIAGRSEKGACNWTRAPSL